MIPECHQKRDHYPQNDDRQPDHAQSATKLLRGQEVGAVTGRPSGFADKAQDARPVAYDDAANAERRSVLEDPCEHVTRGKLSRARGGCQFRAASRIRSCKDRRQGACGIRRASWARVQHVLENLIVNFLLLLDVEVVQTGFKQVRAIDAEVREYIAKERAAVDDLRRHGEIPRRGHDILQPVSVD